MDQCFYLHQVTALQKVNIKSIFYNKINLHGISGFAKGIISFSIFTEELMEHYGNIKSNTFFS